jgi:4-hydroxy-tetrahydrodipicolinate synthase
MSSLPRGILAAVVTPITDTLEPDLDRLLEHCRALLQSGCDGLVLLATAGEANSLSLAQRLRVLDAAVQGGLPLARLVFGGGSSALDEAATMTRAITEAGAAGVLLLPPFYYRDTGEEGLFRFYAALIERVGMPKLRILLHHRPQASGAPITSKLIARLCGGFGAVIAGVQNGGGEWAVSAALIPEFPDLAIYSGTERLLLDTLKAGGQGVISATINLTAPLAAAVAQDWHAPTAEALQRDLTGLRTVFDGFPTPQAPKEMLARQSGAAGWRNVLPPLMPLAVAEADSLARQLGALPAFRQLRSRPEM